MTVIPFQSFTPLIPLLSRVDLVAWDCDGTLIDNEKRALDVICQEIGRYVIKQMEALGLPFDSAVVDCCRPLAGKPLKEIRNVYSDYLGFEIPEEVEHAIKARRLVSPEKDEVVEAIEPFAALARFLKRQGVYQRVATGSEPDRALRYIEAAGLTDIFSDCGSNPWLFSGHKPCPKAHCATRESLLITPFGQIADPKRTVGLEDSVSGIKACVADGIIPVGHALASHLGCARKHEEKLLKAGAVAVIKRPEDIIPVLHAILSQIPERAVRPALQASAALPTADQLACALGSRT